MGKLILAQILSDLFYKGTPKDFLCSLSDILFREQLSGRLNMLVSCIMSSTSVDIFVMLVCKKKVQSIGLVSTS